MVTLRDLLDNCNAFTPQRPTSTDDLLHCTGCGEWSPGGFWNVHDGCSSGYYCEDCNDFHACIACPFCGDMHGMPGAYSPVAVRPLGGD